MRRVSLQSIGVSALVLAAVLCSLPTVAQSSDEQGIRLVVSAAADLTPAFEELATTFEESTGIAVDFNFGSTGQLAEQIKAGAPVDVFAAANVSYVDDLEADGLIIPDTKALYAQGRIIYWQRDDSPSIVKSCDDLLKPEIKRIALANPDHAPYGIAAREALQSCGVWDQIQDKVILGENVRDTLQYASTGNVDVAIVALSLGIQSDGGVWELIPADLHEPIDQALAVVRGTKHEAEARAFALFVNSDEGRAILKSYGFVIPGESIDSGTPISTGSPIATPSSSI